MMILSFQLRILVDIPVQVFTTNFLKTARLPNLADSLYLGRHRTSQVCTFPIPQHPATYIVNHSLSQETEDP